MTGSAQAYFVDGVSMAETAERFAYSCAALRKLPPETRRRRERPFYLSNGRQAGRAAAARSLGDDDRRGVWPRGAPDQRVHRRPDSARPGRGAARRPIPGGAAAQNPSASAVADRRELNVTPRRFDAALAGPFLFAGHRPRRPPRHPRGHGETHPAQIGDTGRPSATGRMRRSRPGRVRATAGGMFEDGALRSDAPEPAAFEMRRRTHGEE